MNKVLKYLQQPFPIIHKPWLAVVIPSSIVMLIIIVMSLFQPYGIQLEEAPKTILYTAIFGLITLIPILIVLYLLPLIFKGIYTLENWTVGRYALACLCILGMITIGNCIFYNSFTRHSADAFYRTYTFWTMVTFSVGLIPISIITFITKNNELINNLKYAQELNEYLEEANAVDKTVGIDEKQSCSKKITLSGDTREAVELIPENIIYIEASGNYVLINHKENQIINQIQLRTTLSKIESDLQQYSAIIRCHRAFLVNCTHVVNVKGNSKGFLLHFYGSKENIPVSRTYLKTIQDKFHHKIVS